MSWKSVDNYSKHYTKDTVLGFGKYKGQTIKSVMQYDAQYILWAQDEKWINIKDQELLDELTDLMYEQASYDDDPYEADWYVPSDDPGSPRY